MKIHESAPGKPIPLRYFSVNLTPHAGADDSIFWIRILPDGRDGSKVYARRLADGEHDSGDPVWIDPQAGETVHFRSPTVPIRISDVDRNYHRCGTTYHSLTRTLWGWLNITAKSSPANFRHVLASARRLDASAALLGQVHATLNDVRGSFQNRLEKTFLAYALAELFTVALGRSIDMISQLPAKTHVKAPLPALLRRKRHAIREIRNAFEHIEDRAAGNVRGKPDSEALSAFRQDELLAHRRIKYGTHVLDLWAEAPCIILDARFYTIRVAEKAFPPIPIPSEALTHALKAPLQRPDWDSNDPE